MTDHDPNHPEKQRLRRRHRGADAPGPADHAGSPPGDADDADDKRGATFQVGRQKIGRHHRPAADEPAASPPPPAPAPPTPTGNIQPIVPPAARRQPRPVDTESIQPGTVPPLPPPTEVPRSQATPIQQLPTLPLPGDTDDFSDMDLPGPGETALVGAATETMLPRTMGGPSPAVSEIDIGDEISAKSLDGALQFTMSRSVEGLLEQQYEVEREIARGGMGAILRATDLKLGRRVAMKVMREDVRSNPDTRRRFMREAKITGQLEHPNIVPVHELGYDRQRSLYFTMKLVKGTSLAQRLRELKNDVVQGRGESGFPLTERLDVFRKVCDAIAFAHSRRVLHRDLKPDNIMVGEFGEVQVMDWGLAKVVGEEDVGTAVRASASTFAQPGEAVQLDEDGGSKTMDGDIMGTPQYMSPEQAMGKVNELDPRTDVYSLGAILFELVTLVPPFTGQTSFAIMHQVIQGRLPTTTERLAKERDLAGKLRVPAELEAIIRKAMSLRTQDRYVSARKLRADIDQYLEGRLVGAARYTWSQRLWKRAAQNRTAVLTSTVVLVMLIAGVIGVWLAVEETSRAKIREALADDERTLTGSRTAVDAARAQLAAGDWRGALAATTALRHQQNERLIALASRPSETVRTWHPEWIALAAALPDEIRAVERDAAITGARAALAELPPAVAGTLADATPAQREFARAAFDEFRQWLSAGDDLPAAEFAWWLARAAADRADRVAADFGESPTDTQLATWRREEREMAEWVAAAWQCQPDSVAAGNGFLMLAERDLQRIQHSRMLDTIIQRLHTAWSVFADNAPALRPQTLVRLATALLGLDPGSPTPFAPDVPAHTMALRCILQILRPDGSVTAAASEWMEPLPEVQRETILRSARDLLDLLRWTVGERTAPRLLSWPADDADAMGWNREALTLYRVAHPDGPGGAPPVVTAVRTIPWTDLGFDQPVTRASVERAPPTADLARPLVIKLMAADGPIAVFSVPDCADLSRHTRFAIDRCWWNWSSLGDLTGNGLLDMVVSSAYDQSRSDPDHAEVAVYLQTAPGAWSPSAIRVRTGNLASTVSRSSIRRVHAKDMDGDGRCELIVARNRFNHYNIIVYEIGTDGTARELDEVMCGYATPTYWPAGDGSGELLIFNSVASLAEVLHFEARGHTLQTGLHVYRLRDRRLQEVACPWPVPDSVSSYADWAGFGDVWPLGGATGDSFVLPFNAKMTPPTGGYWVHYCWLMFRGSLPEPDEASVWHLPVYLVEPLTPSFANLDGRVDGGVARRLRDRDLLALAGDVPVDIDRQPEGHPLVQLAATLLDFGHPEATDALLQPALADPQGMRPEVLRDLRELRLRARVEARDWPGVREAVISLPVKADYLPMMLDATTQRLRATADVDGTIAMLEPWHGNRQLPGPQRGRLGTVLRPLVSARDVLAGPGIEVRGRRVRENGADAGTIADYWITTQHDIVRVPSMDSPWRCLTSGPMLVGDGEDLYVTAIPGVVSDSDGESTTVGDMHAGAGVPVYVSRQDLRVTVEFEVPGAFWDSYFHVGLMEVAPDGLHREESLEVQTRGDLHAFQMVSPVAPNLVAYVDRRLRWDMLHLESLGLRRYTLVDAETGELLYAKVVSLGRDYEWSGAVRSPWRYLGVRRWGKYRCELTVHSLQVRGAVSLWPIAQPQRESFPDGTGGRDAFNAKRALWKLGEPLVPHDVSTRAFTGIACARFAGDRELADQLLRDQSQRYLRAAATARDRLGHRLQHAATFLQFDAAWERSDGKAEDFAGELAAIVRNTIGATPSREQAISALSMIGLWLLSKPQWPADSAMWEGVGGAAMSLLLGEGQQPDELIRDMATQSRDLLSLVPAMAMADWLVLRSPGAAHQDFRLQVANVVGWNTLSSPLFQPLHERLIQVLAVDPDPTDERRALRMALEIDFHRRASALAIATESVTQLLHERVGQPLATLTRRVHAEALAEVDRYRRAAARLGIEVTD